MLTKQKAIILAKNIRNADAAIDRLMKSLKPQSVLSASRVSGAKRTVKGAGEVAKYALAIVAREINSKDALNKASKSKSFETLLTEASRLHAKALVAKYVLKGSEEFSDLEDAPVANDEAAGEFDDLEAEGVEFNDAVSDEPIAASDEEVEIDESLDAEGEELDIDESVEAEGDELELDETIDADGEELEIDAEGEELDLDEDISAEGEELEIEEDVIPAARKRVKATKKAPVRANRSQLKNLRARSTVKASKGFSASSLEKMWNFGSAK